MSAHPVDIGQLASNARTVIDDPGLPTDDPGPPMDTPEENERWAAAVRWASDSNKSDIDHWRTERECYAIACLDAIIAITDPVDDEHELARVADSLDALGRQVERLRENLANEHGPLRDEREREVVSDTITRSLDTLDEAIEGLRAAHEAQEEDIYECEDCSVNGEDCRVHGEAWKLASRAIMESPDGVVSALRNAGLGVDTTERG